MNERIRELVEQAGGFFLPANVVLNKPSHIFLEDDQVAKFAELIIRECMAQCVKVENDDELSNYEGGFRDGALLCYQEIKEHFGVEQ